MLGRKGYTISALFVDYGQAAVVRERKASQNIARYLNCHWESRKISPGLTSGKGEIQGRNAFLVATALLTCASKVDVIALAIHGGTPYYDCSPAFAHLMDRMVAEHSDGRIRLLTPFLRWTKTKIVDYSRGAALPISLTYSCEMGQPKPCGICLSCRDRRSLGVS